MNKFIIALFFISFGSYSQIISFDYDEAGNQAVRQWCTSCHNKNSNEPVKEIADLQEEDLQQFFKDDVISYYPNPVKEQLYLQWKPVNGSQVNLIQLYSLNGELIQFKDKLEGTNKYVMSFQHLPQGVYSLILFYTDGTQQSIKIIKK